MVVEEDKADVAGRRLYLQNCRVSFAVARYQRRRRRADRAAASKDKPIRSLRSETSSTWRREFSLWWRRANRRVMSRAERSWFRAAAAGDRPILLFPR